MPRQVPPLGFILLCSGFLDLGSYLVDDLFDLLLFGRLAEAIFVEQVADLAAEFLTFFRSEQQSCTGAYDSTAKKSVKQIQ